MALIDTYTVQRKDQLGFRATRGYVPMVSTGERCYVPASLTSGDYQAMLDLYTACIFSLPGGLPQDYEAFPNGLANLVNGRLFILYTNRESHVDGANVIMARVNDPWNFSAHGDANGIDQVVFRAGNQPIAECDTSLIAPHMVPGNAFIFTRTLIWMDDEGEVHCATLPLLAVPGFSPNFTQQSIDRLMPDGFHGRFGYQNNTLSAPYSSTGFFVSDDATKQTWGLRAIAASDQATKRFTEADFAIIPGAQVGLDGPLLVALYREDNSGDRNIFINLSLDLGYSWTTPVRFDPELVSGTQPTCQPLPNGDVIWSFGDRTGTSGNSPLGHPRQYKDQTGIKLQRMTAGKMTAGSWSLGFATATTDKPHKLFPGNPVMIGGSSVTGWNTEMAICEEGTSGSTIVYRIRNNPTAFSGTAYVIGMGWERQILTFIGTDGGQYEFVVLDDGETVLGFSYGQRRQPQGSPSPRITATRVNTRNV